MYSLGDFFLVVFLGEKESVLLQEKKVFLFVFVCVGTFITYCGAAIVVVDLRRNWRSYAAG